jgi:hypothetical protein
MEDGIYWIRAMNIGFFSFKPDEPSNARSYLKQFISANQAKWSEYVLPRSLNIRDWRGWEQLHPSKQNEFYFFQMLHSTNIDTYKHSLLWLHARTPYLYKHLWKIGSAWSWDLRSRSESVSLSTGTSSTTEKIISCKYAIHIKSEIWTWVSWFYHKKPNHLS